VSSSEEKYDALAEGFSEREYADPARYSAGRARLVVELGPRLERGATVVDLGCGDGIMAGPLGEYGLIYTGIDSSTQMVEAARRRHPGLTFVAERSEAYRPPEPIDATICLRAFYYPEDRIAFFRGIAEYTKQKFVFDFRQAAHPADTVERDLRTAGFNRIVMRPYFVPQRRAVPGLAANALAAAERTGPLGLFLSRYAGRVFCSASV
jgi:SAM-dependent methyltransferase